MNIIVTLFSFSLLFILQVKSMNYTLVPTTVPTPTPLYSSKVPTVIPTTMMPSTSIPSTLNPSNIPTATPTLNPSNLPTAIPTTQKPTNFPTCIPSLIPTNIPSHSPSIVPSTIHPTKPLHERYGNGTLSNKIEAIFMLLSLLFLVIGAMYYVYLREKSRQEPKHVIIRRDEDDIQLDLELNEVDYDNPWSIVSHLKSRVTSMFSSSQFTDNVYTSVNLNGSDDGSEKGEVVESK